MSEEGSSQSSIDETNRRKFSNTQGTVRHPPGQGECDPNRRFGQQVQSQIRPIARSRRTVNVNQRSTAPQGESRGQQQFQSPIRPTASSRNTLNINQHQIASPQGSTSQNQTYVPPQRRQGRSYSQRDGSQLQHRLGPQMNSGHQHRHGDRGLCMNRPHCSSNDRSRSREKDRNSANGFKNHRNERGDNRQRNRKAMGFRALQEIADADPRDAIAQINARKDSFLQLINSSSNDNRDIYFLVVQTLSKVSLSSFDELKSRLLLEVCFTEFVTNLRIYLMDLPYCSQKAKNSLYWKNQEVFWENFITFSESIFDIAPSVTLNKCRPLIEATSNYCLMELKTKQLFSLSVENQTRLTDLHKKFAVFEQKDAEGVKQRNRHALDESAASEPPEEFRQLSVVPARADLLGGRPFLRANVVRGAYRDAEHYLDVQFRLLREDCFGPVRIGLQQYLDDPNKKEYENIRVYRDVKFTGPYVGKNHIGVTVQLGETSMKRLKRINWSHSKRFIYGSLLLFTNDYCQSFIATTIIDRDIKCLAEGKLPVRIMEGPDSLAVQGVDYNSTYIMIESEVYFEPYQHVLKALQEPSFPRHIAMSQYIIKVDTEPKPPSYITDTSSYSVKILEGQEVKFNVLNPFTWPLQEALGFNESQYEAYKLALTHEFAVIQGPPGTGKTYLGVNVAKTLLNNSDIIQANTNCMMLVICYTNHALDQFLEHILTITKSIVRIGGQSKNPAMESISINTLRKTTSNLVNKYNTAERLYKSERYTLSLAVNQLQMAQNRIKSLNEGIMFYNSLEVHVPEAMVLRQYYRQTNKDIVDTWLFENMPYTNIQEVLAELNVADDDYNVPLYTDNHRTAAHVADELWDIKDENGVELNCSTILLGQKLKQLISYCNNNANKIGREQLDEIHIIHSRMTFFKEMRDTYRANGVPREIRNNEDLSRLPNIDRWSIYFTWTDKVMKILIEETKPLQNEVDSAVASCEEAKMMLDLNLLRNIKVVGMTTSGAARQRKLLKALAPRIVIVEEAAEVLEQHIVTSLTSSCQHLILIGDHQQLRPSVAFMQLARHYNIDVSLFERMVLNGVHSRRLAVQHRMRPEIAALIAPHIYTDLANHPSVEAYPHVRGITADLFFFTHNYKEDTTGDSTIRTNQKEADMVLGLANYIMQQDYEPCDVTILVAYVGQLFYMKKQSQKYAFLNNVKITVVDNYQGEESKIILLSLVRNNDQNKIGFLATDNRICVALSRAKEGFYIFGNINTLKSNSKLWTNVAKTLEDQGSIGTELRLKCENHPNQFTTITSVEHFNNVPEGGCLLKCNYNLPACLHRCPRMCHGYDRNHTDRICEQKCERIICDLGHVCPLLCAVECKPCRKPMTKTLPCGHDKQVACYLEPDDPTIKCGVILDVILPSCGHQAKKQCHVPLSDVRCTVPCVYRLDGCGHACRRHCHVTDDPDHAKYECKQPCARAKKGCSADVEGDRGPHQCPKLCHETCEDCNVLVKKKRSKCKHTELVKCCGDADAKICPKKCARVLPCSHFCKKKCHEPCGGCTQQTVKIITKCKHTIKIACNEEARHELCRNPCERRLSCGHPCGSLCGAPCDDAACEAIIPDPVDAPCGHKVMPPCNVYRKRLSDPLLLLRHCTEPCNAVLKCEHVCGGTCSQCRQGRLHASCTQPCHALNICGHQCEEPCNQLCPPCEKPCEVKCDHSQCSNVCGAPCVPCKEPCRRSCVHGACSRRCGEVCSRAACALACPRALPCGHPCRGLCGEPCPPVCRLCNPDRFPKDFLGDDFDEDAKFIKLQDCSHILEVEDADNLMQGDKETISIRSCPFCRKPIINTYRYKDTVNQMYKTEINPIKERVYGTKDQVIEKRAELIGIVEEFKKTHQNVLNDNKHFKSAYIKLWDTFRRQKKISKLQIDMHFLYVNILDMIGDKYKKFIEAGLTTTYFDDQVKMLCNFLGDNLQKISQQQQEDIGNEIMRLHSIHQLARIKTHSSYLSVKKNPKVMEAQREAEACVISFNIFKEPTAIIALKKFAKAMDLSTVITMQERQMIVQAMGLKQGHWYKCPNGHFYCITECGGAMEVGKCSECKAEIGGQNHRLLQTNTLAREMDGAQFAAWSEEYNNMANFNFDDM